MNEFLLSEVMFCGNPKHCNHPEMNTLQQLCDVASALGSTSSHLLVLSKTVSKYFMPLEGGICLFMALFVEWDLMEFFD